MTGVYFEPIFDDLEILSIQSVDGYLHDHNNGRKGKEENRNVFLSVENFEHEPEDIGNFLQESVSSNDIPPIKRESSIIGEKRKVEDSGSSDREPVKRKQAHKEHSRRYRANVATKFKELTDLVAILDSDVDQKNPSKSKVLHAAFRIIREYKERVTNLDMEVALSSHKNLLSWIDRAVQGSDSLFTALCPLMKLMCKKKRWTYAEVWFPSRNETANQAVLRLRGAHVAGNSALATCGKSPVALFKKTSEQFSFPPGVGLVGRVYGNMKPEFNRDLTNSKVFSRAALASRYGIQCGFGVPIVVCGKCEGVLNFFDTTRRTDFAENMTLANMMTNYVGLAYGAKVSKAKASKGSAKQRVI